MKKIIKFDWNGTLISINDELVKIGLDCIRDHFDTSEIERKDDIFRAAGLGFKGAIDAYFPDADPVLKEKCYQEFKERQKTVYAENNNINVPCLREILEILSDKNHLAISSGSEKRIISDWARKNNFSNLFRGILGNEDGDKKEHIEKIRRRCGHDVEITSVGNSPADMNADINIGIASDKWEEGKLKEAGATYVVGSLAEMLEIK